MTRNDRNTFEEALSEAAKWFAREEAGDMTSVEKEELENLLAHDADFQMAYLDVMRSASLIDSLSGESGKDTLGSMAPDLAALAEEHKAPEENRQRPLRTYGWIASIAASFLVLVFSAIWLFQDASMSTTYLTKVGESRTIMLKDGSVITLNTDTRISVALASKERRILLEKGEAYFNVAKDKARPFVVVVGDETVRAVGTAFNIRRRANITNVTVTEGIVEVKNIQPAAPQGSSAPLAKPVSLTAGEELITDRQTMHVASLSPEELAQKTSWREGMLHFRSKRLDAVLREIQYYVEKEIILASDQVGEIIVGGSLNTQNVSSFLKGLEVNFPINVIERRNVIIISYEGKRLEELNASNQP